MAKVQIKLASSEGRTFAVGQKVVARGEGEKTEGKIVGFVRSVGGDLILAKIRIDRGRPVIRAWLQDIEAA